MIQSQNNIFSQSFYWKFQAPNKEELSTFVLAQESGDPVPWGNLCSVKMTQILDDILPMMQPSINKFCEEAADAGIDGLIVADLPSSESNLLLTSAKKHGISLIPLLALTSSEDSIKLACKSASGFVYCISVLGVTGARKKVNSKVKELVKKVKTYTDIPVAIGFGISKNDL